MKGVVKWDRDDVAHYWLEGVEVSEAEFRAALTDKMGEPGVPRGPALSGWPLKSDNFGCHPDQAVEAEAHAIKCGVPVEYDRQTGQAIFTDHRHQMKALKSQGYMNRDAYSGG